MPAAPLLQEADQFAQRAAQPLVAGLGRCRLLTLLLTAALNRHKLIEIEIGLLQRTAGAAHQFVHLLLRQLQRRAGAGAVQRIARLQQRHPAQAERIALLAAEGDDVEVVVIGAKRGIRQAAAGQLQNAEGHQQQEQAGRDTDSVKHCEPPCSRPATGLRREKGLCERGPIPVRTFPSYPADRWRSFSYD